MKKRKYKVYEVTTEDYGKGLVFAGSERTALKKIRKKSTEKFKDNMTSYYDRGTKKQMKKKYRGIF